MSQAAPARRVFNFSSGPAVLPEEVLAQASAEMLDWHGSGVGVMEMSHRGREFIAIAEETEQLLRELMAIPDGYKVLLLQGGATLQFSQVPLNLLRGRKSADFVVTGQWSRKAFKEAQRFCEPSIAASSEDGGYTGIPPQAGWKLSPDAAYVHIASNETIGGVEFHWVPDTGGVPLVADMSSDILSRPIDVSRYGLIYAGAQKNIGPAGLTIVIVREDLLGGIAPGMPTPMDYAVHAAAGSMSNTPPTWAIYIAGLVLRWIKRQGGTAEMERRNRAKAERLYAALDASSLYANPIRREDRSIMNVPFTLAEPSLDAEFLAGAERRGMVQLKGHRSVGGMRASLYNAMPMAGVERLVEYMAEFEAAHPRAPDGRG